MSNAYISLRCSACLLYLPAAYVGIRDRIDERGGEVTELVCCKCLCRALGRDAGNRVCRSVIQENDDALGQLLPGL